MTIDNRTQTIITEVNTLTKQLHIVASELLKIYEDDIEIAMSVLMTSHCEALAAVLAMNKSEEKRKHLVSMCFASIVTSSERISNELEEVENKIKNAH